MGDESTDAAGDGRVLELNQALAESEERFRTALEALPGGVFAHNLDGRLLFVNAAACQNTGYSREELLRMTVEDIDPSAGERGDRERYWQAIHAMGSVVIESTHVRKDGSRYPAEVRISPAVLGGERIVLALAFNVTQRKRAEAALRDSEERYRSLVEGMTEALVAIDLEGRIRTWNRGAVEIFGFSASEALGQHYRIFCPGDFRESQRASVEAALNDGRGSRYESVRMRKDGMRIPVDVTLSALRDSQGKLIGLTAILRDVTTRARAEQQARRHQRIANMNHRIANVFLTAPADQTYADVLDIVLETLDSPLGLFGYIRDDGDLVCPSMTGEVWDRLRVPGRDIVFPKTKWSGLWGRSLLQATTVMANEGLKVPGGHLPLACAIAVPIVHGGTVIGQVCVANKDGGYDDRDREMLESAAAQTAPVLAARLDKERQRKVHAQLEEQLRQSQKMEAVGRLAGGVAHDFNNLLTVINSYAELVLDSLDERDPLRGDVGQIAEAGERARLLTRQLLAFSRKQVLEPRVLDLNDVVLQLERMLRRLIGEDIEFLTTLHPGLRKVYADPGQIEQVLMNLVINARDAMPQGGKLTVETANAEVDDDRASKHLDLPAGDYVLIAVTDSGVGMTPEVKSRIFEPFFTTKGKGRSTGLGLATVYGIVKQSGATITVYSEPDRGTTFKIYLPSVQQQVTPLPKPERPADTRGTETVLVVEDEPAVRDLVRRTLVSAGYQVLAAADGHEALAVSERHDGDIHLVLTDVVMPRMSGKALADRLAAARPACRVLYMSGYTENAIVHHGVLKEGTQFLAKPFLAPQLLGKVREVLDVG